MKRSRIRFSARSLGIFLPLTVLGLLMTPAVGAPSVQSFSEPFWGVLDNLMTHYWDASDDGVWLYDMWDAPQYSTELLYPLAAYTGDPLYAHRADRTVEYVISIASLSQLIEKLINGEDISAEGAALPALIHGYRYYQGSNPYAFGTEAPLICALAGDILKTGVPFPFMNGYSGPGAVAYYDLLLAYTLRDHGLPGRAMQSAVRAYDLLKLSDAYWVQETEDSGYYEDPDSQESDHLWHWGLVLQAVALAYQASGNPGYLARAEHMLGYFEQMWDENPPYGYRSRPGWVSKVLSPNFLMAKSLLILYDATADPRWLHRAHQVIECMTDPILLGDDVLFPGYPIIYHHWAPEEGTAGYACSGCNLAVLSTIYEYNRLERDGPAGPDPLPSCVIATAVLDSGMERQLGVFHRFRDLHLVHSHWGRTVVDLYYVYSPPLADALGRCGWLKSLMRVLLLPVVGLVSLLA